MKGTRPLDNQEIRQVSAIFDGTFEIRNRVSTGGRISELLGLQIGDVYQNRAPLPTCFLTNPLSRAKNTPAPFQ